MKANIPMLLISFLFPIFTSFLGFKLEIEFLRTFGFLAFGFPIGYTIGLLLKSKRNIYELNATTIRVIFFLFLLVAFTALLFYLKQYGLNKAVLNGFNAIILIMIILSFVILLLKKKN